uniref:VWFD domain-containing protein n=1 Tax=Monopterus albus TaxID=43700 RepID=A0A3Q3IUW9_MONAL
NHSRIMRLARMLLEWVIPWLTLCLGLTTASFGRYSQWVTENCMHQKLYMSSTDKLCSTWGKHKYKNFDGDYFQVVSSCNLLLVSDCKSSYESFNVQLQRQNINGVVSFKKITLKLEGTFVEISDTSLKVNDKLQTGISITQFVSHLKIEAKLGLVATLNQDSFWVELDAKFRNQTCGMCGDFNGVQLQYESTDSNLAFIWKVNGPTEQCDDITSPPLLDDSCFGSTTNACYELLELPALNGCQNLIDRDAFFRVCGQNYCTISNDTSTLCSDVSEYSRQCANAGGHPGQWRYKGLCELTCPLNMEYNECGSPCIATCTNPQQGPTCGGTCVNGCYCPSGTLLDDITNTGCVAVDKCPCLHNGNSYNPGATYSDTCQQCTCAGGQWSCVKKDCPGTCSMLGGSQIFTYDGKGYNFHGECSYVLSKSINGTFSVIGEMAKCQSTETSTCLTGVILQLSQQTIIAVTEKGLVTYNQQPTTLPFARVINPTSFYIAIQASCGVTLEIQLIPVMQVYIKADVFHKGNLNGLCGNFNDIGADDFTTQCGLTEGTALTFVNTWVAQPNCPSAIAIFGDPCTASIDRQKYAKYWCALLSDPNEAFAECHSTVSPYTYETSCVYATCTGENSEDRMCAALSAYVHACASAGVVLTGETMKCETMYDYQMTSCGRTCRSLSQPDLACNINFTPLDGCGCAEGTYQNEEGECVSASHCSCYVGDTVVMPSGILCNTLLLSSACTNPMVFFNCSSAKPGDKGSECQKTCQTVDTDCVSTKCMSGCVCPDGLLSNGNGGCIKREDCPCTYNGETYNSGQSVTVDCNKCACKNGSWDCTNDKCDGTCLIYGEGNYITFDQRRFSFNGQCGYIFAQDYCGDVNGTFRILTENIPCGTSESICSTAVKLYLGNNEIVLSEDTVRVNKLSQGVDIPFHVNTMGIYFVIEANNGLVLIWDRTRTVMIKLSPKFQGTVCGLCGNFDGNSINDLTTRSNEVVVDPITFGNSWKLSPTCPNVDVQTNPCVLYSQREAWALKHCGIITSDVFASCHAKVRKLPKTLTWYTCISLDRVIVIGYLSTQ